MTHEEKHFENGDIFPAVTGPSTRPSSQGVAASALMKLCPEEQLFECRYCQKKVPRDELQEHEPKHWFRVGATQMFRRFVDETPIQEEATGESAGEAQTSSQPSQSPTPRSETPPQTLKTEAGTFQCKEDSDAVFPFEYRGKKSENTGECSGPEENIETEPEIKAPGTPGRESAERTTDTPAMIVDDPIVEPIEMFDPVTGFFTCRLCVSRVCKFKEVVVLSNHMKNFHRRLFPCSCPCCTLGFYDEEKMKAHLGDCDGPPDRPLVIVCTECDSKQFETVGGFLNHIEKRHTLQYNAMYGGLKRGMKGKYRFPEDFISDCAFRETEEARATPVNGKGKKNSKASTSPAGSSSSASPLLREETAGGDALPLRYPFGKKGFKSKRVFTQHLKFRQSKAQPKIKKSRNNARAARGLDDFMADMDTSMTSVEDQPPPPSIAVPNFLKRCPALYICKFCPFVGSDYRMRKHKKEAHHGFKPGARGRDPLDIQAFKPPKKKQRTSSMRTSQVRIAASSVSNETEIMREKVVKPMKCAIRNVKGKPGERYVVQIDAKRKGVPIDFLTGDDAPMVCPLCPKVEVNKFDWQVHIVREHDLDVNFRNGAVTVSRDSSEWSEFDPGDPQPSTAAPSAVTSQAVVAANILGANRDVTTVKNSTRIPFSRMASSANAAVSTGPRTVPNVPTTATPTSSRTRSKRKRSQSGSGTPGRQPPKTVLDESTPTSFAPPDAFPDSSHVPAEGAPSSAGILPDVSPETLEKWKMRVRVTCFVCGSQLAHVHSLSRHMKRAHKKTILVTELMTKNIFEWNKDAGVVGAEVESGSLAVEGDVEEEARPILSPRPRRAPSSSVVQDQAEAGESGAPEWGDRKQRLDETLGCDYRERMRAVQVMLKRYRDHFPDHLGHFEVFDTHVRNLGKFAAPEQFTKVVTKMLDEQCIEKIERLFGGFLKKFGALVDPSVKEEMETCLDALNLVLNDSRMLLNFQAQVKKKQRCQ